MPVEIIGANIQFSETLIISNFRDNDYKNIEMSLESCIDRDSC